MYVFDPVLLHTVFATATVTASATVTVTSLGDHFVGDSRVMSLRFWSRSCSHCT